MARKAGEERETKSEAMLALVKGGVLAGTARGPERALGVMLLISAVLLILGWLLPLMTIHRFLFLSDEISILQGVIELWRHGETLLAFVLIAFSMLFPLAKLTVALSLWSADRLDEAELARRTRWLAVCGKWSMLDVFVVALVVVSVKLSLVADVEVHAGIYVFAGAIVVSMLCTDRILQLAQRRRAEEVGANTSA